MAYKFSFADNEIYSASDINEITKRLVTSGVEDSFTDGVAYNVSKFNEAGKLLYTSGVVPESCLTLRVDKTSDTEILINPGTAFFDDGATIEIEAGGETLPFVSGSKNYVYLKNELVDKNICRPYCGTEEPTGNCVLLAEIDENGVVTDKRIYARGKLPGYQSYAGQMLYFNETIDVTLWHNSSSTASGEGEATFDIGANDFNYALAFEFRTTTEYGGYTNDNLSICRLSDGVCMGGSAGYKNNGTASYSSFHNGCFYIRYNGPINIQENISLSKDGKLKIKVKLANITAYATPGSTSTVSVPINLIFF